MSIKKRLSLIVTTILLAISPLLAGSAAYAQEADFSVAANAAYAVDATSGKVFYDQNGETPVGIASVTKIISAYLVYEQIAEGKLNWEDEVPISKYTAALSTTPDLSNVPLHEGQKYTVQDLMDATIIQSGNAAIAALAEKIAGSEPKFVDMMKEQLKEWGIKDATIVNSSGLTNSYLGENAYPGSGENDENLLSAKDVSIVAFHLIKDYPEVLDISKTTEKTFGAGTTDPVEMVNWNWMLPGLANYKEGVDGLKTGTTDLAGACFVGTIQKEGRRVITVVLNATDHKNNPSARFIETGKLMDYCYDQWSQTEIKGKNSRIPDLKTIPVNEGKQETVPVQLKDPFKVWVKKGMDPDKLTYQTTLDKDVVPSHGIQAPIHTGESVGKARVTLADDKLGYLSVKDEPTVSIETAADVEKANIFVIEARKIKQFFQDLF